MLPVKIVIIAFLTLTSYEVKSWRIENNILIIEKGDNLSNIAHSLYGRGTKYEVLWQKCLDSLKKRNPNIIYDGMRFNLDSLFNFPKEQINKNPIIQNFPLVLEKDKGLDSSAWIAIISACIALFATYFSMRSYSKSIRNAARVEHNNFFQEIDKQLITDPLLWTVYNDPEILNGLVRPNTPLHFMKRKAFLYLHLNSYDSIFYFYHKIIIKNEIDRSTYTSWNNYYRDLYRKSDEFRMIVNRAIELNYYQKGFIDHLKDYLKGNKEIS